MSVQIIEGQGSLALGMSGARFPSTRYQGSKLKLVDWIWNSVSHLRFDSVLDLFSGTASVAYRFKMQGKAVTTNDYLLCNQTIAEALVCNSETRVSDQLLTELLEFDPNEAGGFVETKFSGIFYPDHENRWLDQVAARLYALAPGPEKSLAYFALYQACLAKRPYGLFHRANLYMRTADVARSFGNKATWEKPFPAHFRAALSEAHQAVFSNGREHRALRGDYLDVPDSFDLVYMDPPYLNGRGVGVDYLGFYHFLEGLTEYPSWPCRIAEQYKHKPYERTPNPWHRKDTILNAFDMALEKYRHSLLAISYRSDGIPSVEELTALLARHGRRNAVASNLGYKYVLSNGDRSEVLLISEPAAGTSLLTT